ncbi:MULTISPECIES: MotE family protein [unclassified Bradyrhizobium]|uniref:MotE family protein n=1 Tax=unclassified Bradyrhizobium TaxID=2631580 RepID=UPI000417E36E|nr:MULTISPECIES: MotE family protein [unclassified Bradyrhizobium]MCP3464104.1 MotE family protein [Bradyrhizobium sp. CCGUVB23]
MLKLDYKTHLFCLIAVSVLASASPAAALDEPKPSKPLNLLSFARARAAGPQKPRAPITPPPNDTNSVRATAWAAEDAAPLTTGAVPAPETPPVTRPPKTGSVAPKPAPPVAAAAPENDVAQFCSSVADPAVDARLAWQLKELEKAENLLRERIAEVEAKRTEYEKWMALRDEFLKKAEASVVEIYSRMKPESAATQIASMTDETAAAVLAKLSPRSSSAIFNEMDTARAAHLADLLGGMRRVDDGKTK